MAGLKEAPRQGEQTRHKKNILLVDDDIRNIRLLKGILYSEPYHLHVAQNGTQALQMVEANPPDLILLDIMMPDINGFEVCRTIKSNPRLRIIPIVFVTALSEVSDRIEAMRAGADDFLSKPIDATELIVRVRSLIRVRQLYMEIERVTTQRLQFMAGIAHNLRSPLNALMLSMDILADRLPKDDEMLNQLWQNITTCMESIHMLSNDIMDYYQIEAGEFRLETEVCTLADLVESVSAVAAPLANQRQIAFQIEPVPVLMIDVDRKVIIQIMLNLLTNALKYTEQGGSVYLRAYDLARQNYTLPINHYPPVLALPDAGVVIEIEDTGYGIHPDDYGRIFTEFDRVKAPNDLAGAAQLPKGVGLGLPVSQRMVRLHGGELWFTSTIDQGSTFAFFLPARQFSQ